MKSELVQDIRLPFFARMGAKVYTIERYRDLHLKAQHILTSLGYQAHFFFGDGYEGKPQYGPYDGIVITAAAPEIPEKLKDSIETRRQTDCPIWGKGFTGNDSCYKDRRRYLGDNFTWKFCICSDVKRDSKR